MRSAITDAAGMANYLGTEVVHRWELWSAAAGVVIVLSVGWMLRRSKHKSLLEQPLIIDPPGTGGVSRTRQAAGGRGIAGCMIRRGEPLRRRPHAPLDDAGAKPGPLLRRTSLTEYGYAIRDMHAAQAACPFAFCSLPSASHFSASEIDLVLGGRHARGERLHRIHRARTGTAA